MTKRAVLAKARRADQPRHRRVRVVRHRRVPRGRRAAPPYMPAHRNTNLGQALAARRRQPARPAPILASASSCPCGTRDGPHTRDHASRGRAWLPSRAAPYACRGRHRHDDAATARVASGPPADNAATTHTPPAQAAGGVPRP